jgi:hypothetical protein
MEAAYEADLALRFLEAGLHGNAAGKAFQAFKALLAALAMKYRDALAQRYPGTKRLRSGKAVEAVDWVIAVMPTGLMLEVARDLSQLAGHELLHYAHVALNLHEFQHNGLDRSGVLSRYARLESAAEDVKTLTQYVREAVERPAGRLSRRRRVDVSDPPGPLCHASHLTWRYGGVAFDRGFN